MEIFAAGNKYLLLNNAKPQLVEGIYFVYARKWVKSKNEWAKNFKTYNIGSHYEII